MKELDELIQRYPRLEVCREDILRAYEILKDCFSGGKKLLVAGNGGSCADAEHITGELMKGFKCFRPCSPSFTEKLLRADSSRGKILSERLQGGLPTIALGNHQALNTAFINDVEDGGRLMFAQQVYAYGNVGDVFWGISTSGNSENVIHAAIVARAKGMKVISLTGSSGGALMEFADVMIRAPERETYLVQELHLPIYHCICLMLENEFFREKQIGR